MLDKLQKQISTAVSPSLATSLEPLEYSHLNVHLNWLHWFKCLSLERALVILMGCMVFLSWMLKGCLNNRQTPINCRHFLKRFPICFDLFVLLFLVTPCLAVAVQPCMEWIPIKKIIKKEASNNFHPPFSGQVSTICCIVVAKSVFSLS